MSQAADLRDSPRHPIQVVSRRTGLSPDVIRVWERRYGAVQPQRTDASRRLYSDADVERLMLLRRVTGAGRRIGEVAQMSSAELQALSAEDQAAQAARGSAPAPTGEVGTYLQAALDAVREMAPARLDSVLMQAAATFTQPVLLEEVVVPLIRSIGTHWQDGSLRICQEHLASAVVRAFLDNLRAAANMDGEGPVLLVTTPAGQTHELGALLAAVTAAAEGWNTVYLNPNAPSAEIAAAAKRVQARAVALTITYPGDERRVADELRALARQLPGEVALLVGGRAAIDYQDVLEEIGAQRGASLADLRTMLDGLRRRPAS